MSNDIRRIITAASYGMTDEDLRQIDEANVWLVIDAKPGIHLNAICEILSWGRPRVAGHLAELEKAGSIEPRQLGAQKIGYWIRKDGVPIRALKVRELEGATESVREGEVRAAADLNFRVGSYLAYMLAIAERGLESIPAHDSRRMRFYAETKPRTLRFLRENSINEFYRLMRLNPEEAKAAALEGIKDLRSHVDLSDSSDLIKDAAAAILMLLGKTPESDDPSEPLTTEAP